MGLRQQFPRTVARLTAPVGRGLARLGLSPNTLTTLGLVLTVSASLLIARGRYGWGAAVLLLGGSMDAFDGAVARASGRSTPYGGFYDSVTDRIADGVVLTGLAWSLLDRPRLVLLVVIGLVAAQVTSYVRARAESIDLDCSVGLMERAERGIVVLVGLLGGPLLEPALWVLAGAGVVTVLQRIHHVWCQIDRDLPEELLVLAQRDRAWSRAFVAAARRFYGERNFDGALGGHANAAGSGPAEPAGPTGPAGR
jgi:CDP-diacylglycerol--glycerol-3-phosphate 3-phosphatidyltransferase